MKKLLSVIAVAGMFAFVACGPSAEEKAAAEQKIQDSIAQVEQQRVADSIAAAEQVVNDSLAAVEAKRIQDSIAAAEAKPTKKGKK
ncbi:MAG: hypothetical protein ACOYO1_09150 [Bacteroidales bacterium]